MRFLMSILFVFLFLIGCEAEKPNPVDKEWKVSPMFKSGAYTMIGQENRLGFIYDDNEVTRFYPGKMQKYMWHFWGNTPEETKQLFGQKLKIIGVSEETGEKINVFEGGTGVPNPNVQPPIPDNDKVARAPSLMSLPSKGLWRLDAFIDDKLYGSVVVQVHQQKVN